MSELGLLDTLITSVCASESSDLFCHAQLWPPVYKGCSVLHAYLLLPCTTVALLLYGTDADADADCDAGHPNGMPRF